MKSTVLETFDDDCENSAAKEFPGHQDMQFRSIVLIAISHVAAGAAISNESDSATSGEYFITLLWCQEKSFQRT
jgi:hypothetical protein